jgi:IS4 transposase
MDDCRDEQGNLEPLAVTDLPIIESVKVDNLETPPAVLDVCTLQFHQQLYDLVDLILRIDEMDQMKEPRF